MLLNIITYHYIKDLSLKKNKNFKALDIKIFKKQIFFLKKKYNVLSPEEVHFNFANNKKFKKKDVWLTFDDGYKDHFNNVLPILEKHKLKGSFYPTVVGSKCKKLLDINKIHLILKETKDYDFVINFIKTQYKLEKSNKGDSFENLLLKINTKIPYDNKKTIIIKSLLQSLLDSKLRTKICDKLLIKIYKKKLNKVSSNFYMNLKEIKQLYNMGHEIGLHGYNHYPLNILNKIEKKQEIVNSYNYWKSNNLIKKNWSFCYPFGIHDTESIEILKKIKCNIAITTDKSKLILKPSFKKLAVSRIDTNEVFKLFS